MQSDVMAPLIQVILLIQILLRLHSEQKMYIWKNKVAIPPFIMQDDTLTVSTCGYKTQTNTTLLNTCTSTMGLQFASSKCVRMHVGKTYDENLCFIGLVDSWKEEVVTNNNGRKYDKDICEGKV